jgi:hypothetical protein
VALLTRLLQVRVGSVARVRVRLCVARTQPLTRTHTRSPLAASCPCQAEDAALAKAEAALQDELRRVKVEEAVLQQQLRSVPEQPRGRAP